MSTITLVSHFIITLMHYGVFVLVVLCISGYGDSTHKKLGKIPHHSVHKFLLGKDYYRSLVFTYALKKKL